MEGCLCCLVVVNDLCVLVLAVYHFTAYNHMDMPANVWTTASDASPLHFSNIIWPVSKKEIFYEKDAYYVNLSQSPFHDKPALALRLSDGSWGVLGEGENRRLCWMCGCCTLGPEPNPGCSTEDGFVQDAYIKMCAEGDLDEGSMPSWCKQYKAARQKKAREVLLNSKIDNSGKDFLSLFNGIKKRYGNKTTLEEIVGAYRDYEDFEESEAKRSRKVREEWIECGNVTNT